MFHTILQGSFYSETNLDNVRSIGRRLETAFDSQTLLVYDPCSKLALGETRNMTPVQM